MSTNGPSFHFDKLDFHFFGFLINLDLCCITKLNYVSLRILKYKFFFVVIDKRSTRYHGVAQNQQICTYPISSLISMIHHNLYLFIITNISIYLNLKLNLAYG